MRVLIVTPLYPPDIAGAAPYIKELAKRLKSDYSVTILTYGHLPEQIPGVRIVSIEKRDHIFVRLFHFTRTLIRELTHADVVFIENGPSVELPALLALYTYHKKVLMHVGDTRALMGSIAHARNRFILRLAWKQATHILIPEYIDPLFVRSVRTKKIAYIPDPEPRPEIHPLRDYPQARFDAYELSWNAHLGALTHFFTP